jgi:hypothetical protein
MYYTVFYRGKTTDGSITNAIHYAGVSKSAAINAFNYALANAFSITATPGNLYFAGFSSDLTFLSTVQSTGATTPDKVSAILKNLRSATCVNMLTISGHRPKILLVRECAECDSSDKAVQRNAYGDYLCTDCWTTYLTSTEGLIEYYIGIANGTYNKDTFSEADLTAISNSWAANKSKLNKADAELTRIEDAYNAAIA